MFVYMHTEITGVCIYLHICKLRLRVCVYIYIIFTYIHTEITWVCIYLHICTLDYVCVYMFTYRYTEIACVCIYLHMGALRLRAGVHIIYAH